MRLLLVRVTFLSVFLLLSNSAFATPLTSIGTPVDAFGSSNAVGQIDNRGFIHHFIPLTERASGVYGDGTTGLVSDRGAGGGWLQMFLEFDLMAGVIETANLVLEFDDLDLAGANDPHGFYETVTVRVSGSDTKTSGLIDNINDTSPIYTLSGDRQVQRITFPDATAILDFDGSGSTYLELLLTTHFDFYGKNTPEAVRATLHYTLAPPAEVPEPASMVLLTSGLLGFAARRRREN